MSKLNLSFFLIITINYCTAQDTVYARSIIKKLTSQEFLGRGYVNNGVNKAAKFLVSEFKSIGLSPIGKSFSQAYSFNVNTFPTKMQVSVNSKLLQAGKHYLISPGSQTLKTAYTLFKTDSVNYLAFDERKQAPLQVKLKKKLTYSVATQVEPIATLELLKDSFLYDLKTVEVIYENKFIPNFKCQNVIGQIKGTQYPDSFLLFSAHYDHLGAMGSNTYFPGANDNASGVSVLLNLAKYYKKNPLKYTVVFILFSGEEAGLLGSKYYSEHPVFPLSKIKFLTNLDLLGTGNEGIMAVNAYVFKTQFEKLNTINEQKKYVSQIKMRGKASNSDHYWFSEKGVPCFFIYTMGGIQAYHDIYDIESTLPLTDYIDVCRLLIDFTNSF
jgi:aminopeptidase YwaD